MNKDERENPMKWNKKIGISIICTVLEGLLSGSNFMLMYSIFKDLLNQTMNMKKILMMTAILAGIFLLRLFLYSYGYVEGQIGGSQVSRKIRLFLGDKLKRIPLAFFRKAQTGDYINVATENVNSYEQILTHKIGDIVKNFTLTIMLIIFVAVLDLPAGVILLIAGLLFIPAMAVSFHAVKKYGTRKNAICAENVSSMIEYISGIQTFRAYGIGGTKNKTVTAAMKNYSEISFVYETKIIPDGAIYSILTWLSLPLEILVAGNDWLNGRIDTVSYILICMLPLFLAKLLGTIFVSLTGYKNMMIAKGKIDKVLKMPEEEPKGQTFAPENHEICLRHVGFEYEKGEPVLRDINMTIEDKKLTAIVGDSGSGKSTILNLISKYYEPSCGTIQIGGQKISQVNAEKVLEEISMVDQDVFLFDDTIRNNIRYARPSATDQEIEAACSRAGCEAFIRQLPKGYETMAGEDGNTFSGGERQRLSIARAILKDSPILLLDEATANLDVENELAVKQAIVNLLKKKKTVVMVAHTLSIVQHADKIIVLGREGVIEQGTHEALLRKNGKYAAMWRAEKSL